MMIAEAKPLSPTLFWTPQECARQLGLSVRTLSRLSQPHGSLPVTRLSPRLIRYDRRAVEVWIAEQQTAGRERAAP